MAGEIPLSTLSGPDLEIGEFEGGGDQTFDLVTGATLLGEGLIAVVDQGAATVFVYDEGGALVDTFGGEGDGPGEFRSPADIRELAGDSVRILDSRDLNVTLFSPDLEYAREFPAVSPLADRYLLEGAVTAEEREQMLSVLSKRPFPATRPGFRPATLGEDGRVWVRERLASDTEPALWFVLDADGSPVRAVEVPERLRPMFMRDDVIVGRWRGDFDVHYVHRYALQETGRTVALPDWLDGPSTAQPAPPMPDSIRQGLMSIARNAATEQEIYYSDNFSYSTRVDSLMFSGNRERPEGLGMDVLHATGRGWSMVLTVEGHSGMCTIAFGPGGPPTLRSGGIACSN